MKFLQRVSIKSFLTGVVGFLVVSLVTLSLLNMYSTYKSREEIKRLDIANELSGHVIEASGFQAKERGVVINALSSDVPVEGITVQKVSDLRASGDKEHKNAHDMAQRLLMIDSSNKYIKAALENSDAAYEQVQTARTEVDRNLSLAKKQYDPKTWARVITSLIDADAELRIAAFSSNASKETFQEALRLNIELKQAIWLVSEYAGRERAALATIVSKGRQIDAATLEKLNTYRAIVDLNTKAIQRLKDSANLDGEIKTALSRFEEVFLGRFNDTRAAVYAAGATGKYPLSGKEWIDRSSEAIDTILGVSVAVGKMVDTKVASDLRSTGIDLAMSVAILVCIVAVGVLSMVVIRTKVVSPMQYLKDKMAEVEKTGDLSVSLEVKSRDENAQIASTFNSMLEKFHRIIQEIHASIAHLASSSEELSASATQIAGGTKSQGSRAAQVSTAAQEMSSTIMEVARNVSSASDAAKAASAVATRGGEIVAKTIESMNGISNTAKESSEIISTLGASSKDIGNIINVIDDIADQTNLLALNAAIEAARAGDQGRGFAVVADEVRKLAEKTMRATKEIGTMISAMQDGMDRAMTSMENEVNAVAEGVKLARDAGGALNEIVSKVDVVTAMVQQIATATEEQSATTEQITGDIESVAVVINETSTSAEQIARASEEMAELASMLKNSVEVFKVASHRAGPEKTVKTRTREALPAKGKMPAGKTVTVPPSPDEEPETEAAVA